MKFHHPDTSKQVNNFHVLSDYYQAMTNGMAYMDPMHVVGMIVKVLIKYRSHTILLLEPDTWTRIRHMYWIIQDITEHWAMTHNGWSHTNLWYNMAAAKKYIQVCKRLVHAYGFHTHLVLTRIRSRLPRDVRNQVVSFLVDTSL